MGEAHDQLSNDEKECLASAVERAVAVAGKRRTVSMELFFQLAQLRDEPGKAIPELADLRQLVDATASLARFRHATQHTLGRRVHLGSEFLVGWLIGRAQQTDARQSVENLDRYLGLAAIDVREVLAVDGPNPTESLQIGDYELVPWRSLPVTDAKWDVMASSLGAGRTPTAAVVQRHTIPATHSFPWTQNVAEMPRSIEPALDVLRCITAVTRSGYRLLHSWIEADECIPWAVDRSSFGFDGRSILMGAVVDDQAAVDSGSAAIALRTRSDGERAHLVIALDRFNLACVTGSAVDRAIELGIALESVFAPDKPSDGIANLIRIRAARFLGGATDERQRTADAVKDLYDLRSRAIHAGRFDADDNKKWRAPGNVQQALDTGHGLLQRALVKVIHNGLPTWKDVDLSG